MGRPAAKYRRISRDREGRELGIERQDEDLDAMGERRDLTYVASYFDNDLSASTNSTKPRPDYERMRRDAANGEFEVIAAYTTSRLTRRPREFEDLIDLALAPGIEFQYIRSPEFDLKTAQGREMARTMAARDAGQAEQTAELVQRAVEQRAMAGEVHGGQTPYGYEPVWEQVERRGAGKRWRVVTYAPNLAQVAIVREIYERILNGEGLHGIAQDLHRRGVPSQRGAVWTRRTLHRIITGPTIAGYREYNGQLYEAVWSGIVDRDDWRRVREIVGVITPDQQGSKNWRKGNTNRQKYSVSGLIWCGPCDQKMHGGDVREGRKGFICKVCSQTIVLAHLEPYVLDRLYIDRQVMAKARPVKGDDSGKELRKLIADDDRRLTRLTHEYDDDKIPENEYRERRARLTTRLEEHRAELARLTAARVVVPTPDELRAQWPHRDEIWKRTVLSALIQRVTITRHPKGMATHVTQKRDEDDQAYTDRLARHRALVLRQRVVVTWAA